jgi:hypothetical protein
MVTTKRHMPSETYMALKRSTREVAEASVVVELGA